MSTDALHHLIINLDVQDSGQRTNPGQLILRDVVHDVVRSAFAAARIDQYQPPEDRGDGVLLVLPADVHKQQMLGRWINELHEELQGRNAPLKEPIRIRVGIHAGELHHDDHGVAGYDVNIACRLASCEPAKRALRTAPTATMVVAVSDYIYQSVVRHGGSFIYPDSYRQDKLHTTEFNGPMWLRVLGDSFPPPQRSTPEPNPTPDVPPAATHGGIGSMKIRDSGPVFNQSTFGSVVFPESDRRRRHHER